MCGIAALYSHAGGAARLPIERALTAMRHRGPDGSGMWRQADGQVVLGNTRLGVMDPLTGAQPIGSEDGMVQVVVNGEFYDWESIGTDLESRGHHFRTRSDSEILVHLYEEHGIQCLQRLRGEFAFILWDSRNRLLFAARDRFGVKPLVYSSEGDMLYLASESKGLFAAGIAPAWDHGAFFQAAHVQYTPPDRTLFRGVYQLRPGYHLLASDGHIQTSPYWDFDYPAEPGAAAHVSGESPAGDTRREGDLIAEFRDRLEDAVRVRLRADVPVACHLSGGLDSSAIVGLATKQSRRLMDCFSVSFEGPAYNEQAIAEQMAFCAGAAFHPVAVTQADLVENLSDAVYFSEGLAINGHLTAKFLLSRAIRDAGYKVALTGEGSDEILAGYAHLRHDLWGAGAPGQHGSAIAQLGATNMVSAGIMLPSGPSLPLGAVERTLGFVPHFIEAKGTLGYRVRSVLSRDFLAEFGARDPFEVMLHSFDVPSQLAGRSAVDRSMYLWNKLALANYILRTLGDGTEMAHSVEGRLPFLDHHLFGFARTLPIGMKIRGAVEKYILRESVRTVITDTVYRRQKHPFLAPPLSRYSAPNMDTFIQDRLRSESFRAVPFFDSQKMTEWLDRLPQMDADERSAANPVLMTALCTSILHERYRL